jgi:DtxR family transcriptional regulator, Mn-dependent transcriptional regulator
MTASTPRFSPSVEDYLKSVFALTERGGAASTSALAESLGVAPSSVTGMVKRLAEAGLLEHLPYRGVRLTETGTRESLRIVRRHRILETYLTERLGFAWDDVHDEAERLEHAASDRLIEAMASALDDPSHDPHGAPIPTATGELENWDLKTLADATDGDRVVIRAVQDKDAERLRHLDERGLVPGVPLTVEERQAFDGPLTVRIGDGAGPRQVVGVDLARRIFVSAAD